MNIIADTNLLVRFFIQDDEIQFEKVSNIFEKSRKIIIPTNTLCELVWVLSYSYKLNRKDIVE
ncbi:MAG: PIN domain-containing protein, partial [Neisseriaceae bacterium]|nr:PIN domain-containing protein [Neisseriaceae bacterium]